MAKKKRDVSEYVSAKQAAVILSAKLKRDIRPDYIHRMKGIARVQVNPRMWLYLRSDIEAAKITHKRTNAETAE